MYDAAAARRRRAQYEVEIAAVQDSVDVPVEQHPARDDRYDRCRASSEAHSCSQVPRASQGGMYRSDLGAQASADARQVLLGLRSLHDLSASRHEMMVRVCWALVPKTDSCIV